MRDEEEECGRKAPSLLLGAAMFPSQAMISHVSRNTCPELDVSMAARETRVIVLHICQAGCCRTIKLNSH